MPSSDIEKPHKKTAGAKASRPNPNGSIFRFGKRQGSEFSQASRSASDSTASLLRSEYSLSPSNYLNGEFSISSTHNGPGASYPTTSAIRLVNKRSPSESDSIAGFLGGMDTPTVNTEVEVVEAMVESPEAMSPRPATPSKRTRRDATSPPSRTTTPVPSSSRIHWNLIRNAIVPGESIPSSSRSLDLDVVTPQSGFTTPPPRPQTPKPSRFARLGFRQVVDNTRDMVRDEIIRFEEEVYQACAIARFGDARQRVERDNSQGSYLPFVSTASLPLSAVTIATQTSKSTQSNESIGRTAPSLKQLHQTLVRYASMPSSVGITARLPYESEVLSVLLIPFAMETGMETEERWLAVETFDIAVKSWRGSSQQRNVDRILWCCKAGCIPASPVRSRVLGTLSNLLVSSSPLQDADPLSLQNILQGLQLLLHSFSVHSHDFNVDAKVVHEACMHLLSGECGQLDVNDVSQEYAADWSSLDTEESIRKQIAAEGVVRCMQLGSESLRRWILHESIEAYWPSYSGLLSPLCKRVVARRLCTFLRSSLQLLQSDVVRADHHIVSDANISFHLFLHKALVELEQFPVPTQALEGRALAVEFLLYLSSISAWDQRQRAVELLCKWCDDDNGWKGSLETAVRLLVEKSEWSYVCFVLQGVTNLVPDVARKYIISNVLPTLHTRLVLDPPSSPLPALTSLLKSLVELYPQQFFKPLFGLAGASRDSTIVGQFGIVTALAYHLPDFWIRDSEMMSVALMSEVGTPISKGKAKEGQPVSWSRTRIGQSLIMLELIRCVKELSKKKKDLASPPDGSHAQAYRFFTDLEARLAIFLEAKEKNALIPLSNRILISDLLLEIRLFSRSLKPAPWLRRVVTWVGQSYLGASLRSMDNSLDDHLESPQLIVGDEAYDEIMSSLGKIQSIYVACWQSSSSNLQRGTLIPPISPDPRSPGATVEQSADAQAIRDREPLTASLKSGVASATLRLLVAVCALLTHADHHALGPVLWSQFLDEPEPCIVAPTCFLLTHCLEKFPEDLAKLIENDRCSPDSGTRRTLIRRLMTLYAWRSQLLSQMYVYDRGRRRPFKLARQPIAFVGIDVGSGSYIHEQTEEDRKNLPGGAVPLELRKRLAEVGWEQDELPTDARLETARAPISLFPLSQLDHIDTVRDQATISSYSVDNAKQLLRRKSSSSGHHSSAKRRPVFVPALVSLFSSMAFLIVDSDPAVASAARDAILLMLRDDPVMICRPVMDILSTDLTQVGEAMSLLRAFLHIHRRLPPSASHHIFTHLGGFLKYISRDFDTDPKALRSFSYTVPILSKLINQVSNLSIRDLRRSKFEIYVFPSGSLWFPPTAPPSTMFPQSLGPTINPFDELPPQLVAICMIRTAQNMLLFDMLRHKPQELHTVRKALTGLVLPGENTGKELDARSFLPHRLSHGKRRRSGYHLISLALSRSYLLLLGQVFRTMSRTFNGKVELARLFDGINRILLVHGDDIGIVTHALIACMIAVTRFKRFVSSNRGFTLFMPSLFKVYAEAENHMGIRHAIQYASSRFYAIHEEAYLFQGVDLASSIIVRLERPEDQDWFAGKIWRLFSALKAPPHQGIPDAAGIRDCNMAEEREALIASTVIDETAQTVTKEPLGGEQLKKLLAIGQYDNKLLQLDDLARLFLTVIAHDPTVIRSQNFLTLFRRMAPEFYNGSKSARDVLRDGINALGSALFTKAPRQKASDFNQSRPLQPNAVDAVTHESKDSGYIFDDPSTPCDHVVMRREYLGLVIAFTQMGGELRSGTVRRSLDLVKGLLKESTRPDPEAESIFLHKLAGSSFSRLDISVKHALALLHEVAPVIKAFAFSMDCSGVLDSITELLKRPELKNDIVFVQFVVDQIVGPALEACEDAASENLLMLLPIRASVISLVCRVAALGHADVACVIEKRTPSPGFLAGIVLPLCLNIKTLRDMATEHQWYPNGRTGQPSSLIFVRLVSYAMDACRGAAETDNGRLSPLPSLHRRDSERRKRSTQLTSRKPLVTLAVVVQIIKIIVIRAADDLSMGPIGMWSRVGRFLQQLLDDGDARFALSSGSSPTVSPWQSPQLGPSPDTAHERTRSTSSDDRLSPSPSLSGSHAPRVVDYLTWSLLEFLCCAPSPLTIQLRLWMQEKVYNLDAELKAREVPGPYTTSDSRRVSSSIFTRPRGSPTSPEGLRASYGRFSRTPSELNLSASYSTSSDLSANTSRFPPPSPGSLQPAWSGPRIIHLGPTRDHQLLQPLVEGSLSQDNYLKSLARHAYIGLPSLVQRTRERVRLVQTCMGYGRLLPVPIVDGRGSDEQNETAMLTAWTNVSALKLLAEEAKLIMDEFPEFFHETLDGGFVDVPSNAADEEPQPTSPKREPILF